MKSIVKTTLALALLLPLTGCLDFGWSKKAETAEVVAPEGLIAQQATQESHCSHPGCKKNHSNKHGHHKKDDVEVEIQNLNAEYYDDIVTDEDLSSEEELDEDQEYMI